ncbi:MAG: hypothetical protein GYB56_01070 [Gammaproteobacteria bacterium]|nr:hypothetical protein [Gammaproteobacteria bacterium]
MSFKAYDEYKDSGVEWLGEVPAHWAITDLKYVCDVMPSNIDKKSKDGEIGVYLCNYTDVYYNDKIIKDMSFMRATATCEQINKFSLVKGDVLFTKDSESSDDIANPAYVPEDLHNVVCGYHLSIARPRKELVGLYLKLFFETHIAKGYFATSANGLTRVGLGQYAIDNLSITLPSEKEQTTIAAFLDHETARIDALIEEQQRLIALLKEKRQAVISHTVTKGLDPNVPMKDSGVEWLGEVPAHWETKRVKNILQPGKDSIRPGPFGSDIKGNDFVEESDYRVYNQSTVISRDFNNSAFITKEKFENLISFMVKKGDVLITSRGTIGKISEVDSDAGLGIIHPCIIRLRLNHHIVITSFFTLMFSQTTLATDQLKVASNSTTIDVIYANSLSETWVPLPPKHEQQDIYDKLSGFLSSTNQTIDTAEQLSNLLQERRSALISAAVTGKIDVRDWQPPKANQTAAEPAEASV